MELIGMQDLSGQASHILKAVQQDRAEFVITRFGKPIAVLRPFTIRDAAALADALAAEAAPILEGESTPAAVDPLHLEMDVEQRR